MRTSAHLAAACLLLPLLLACTTMNPTSRTPAPELNDTAWTLASLPGPTSHTGTNAPLATLRFEAGRAQGSDGCNRYGGAYTASTDGRLQFGPQLVSTRMACPEPMGALASAFNAALLATQAYRVDGGQLLLLGADGATLATLAAQPAGLAGTAWQVTGYNNGKQAIVSVLGGTTLTLEFMADGRLRGSGGCNQFGSSYSSTGRQLGIGTAATTRKACPAPEGVMEQEAAFLHALETVASALREGDRLELRSAGGALAVTATLAATRTTAPVRKP